MIVFQPCVLPEGLGLCPPVCPSIKIFPHDLGLPITDLSNVLIFSPTLTQSWDFYLTTSAIRLVLKTVSGDNQWRQ